jgi:hypothetical protein
MIPAYRITSETKSTTIGDLDILSKQQRSISQIVFRKMLLRIPAPLHISSRIHEKGCFARRIFTSNQDYLVRKLP